MSVHNFTISVLFSLHADKGDLFGGTDSKSTEPPKKSVPPSKPPPKEDEDNLFGDTSVNKAQPSQKQAPQRSKSPEDELFSDPLFGGSSTTSSKPTATTTIKNKPRQSESDDSLFGDPLFGGKTSSAPSKEPAPKKPPVVEDDDLFGDSSTKSEGSSDVFPSSKKAETNTKPIKQPPRENGLVSSQEVTKKPPVQPPTAKKPAHKEKIGGLFDDDSDDDLFAVSKPSAVPTQEKKPSPVTAKKKPAGAVSLFGGVDPFGAAGIKEVGVTGKSHDKAPHTVKGKSDLLGIPCCHGFVVSML